MDTRSRVWPILVANSLSLDQPLALHCPDKRECRHLNCRRPNKKTASSTKRLRCNSSRTDGWCSTGVSDIFCVTGGITAITGSLVASFGVYPKNQASIRLYLECFGCAMVIVGVLIIFVSLKMRPGRGQDRGDKLLNFEPKFVARHPQSRLESRRRKFTESSSRRGENGVVAPIALVEMVALASNRMQHLSLRDNKFNNALSDEELEIVGGGGKDNISINLNNWTPADDGYGDGHQAAIEAALSTALTVSTLVGFRAGQITENHCCLHHAVQHRTSAQKWIKALRISRRYSAINNQQLDESSTIAVEETTLMEDSSSIETPSEIK